MTPERWERIGEIFDSAMEMEPGERAERLRELCGGDNSLLAEVESILDAGDDAGRFISQPIVGKFVPEFADHIESLSPGKTLGHYKIEKAIGSGGMGEVYLATDTKLGRQIALKTLPPALASDPSFLRRFRNEAQAAANINHPNVATVYSVENVDGLQFITMEYVDGKTLDRLTPEAGLEFKAFLEWLEPIANALAAAHKRGITHRDIKPGNIMISADGTPKILDFGLAQVERSMTGGGLSKEITAPGQIIGTPSYMSPEQAEGAGVDARSDIFSFGTVMYEALTGKRPFRGASQGLIVKAVVHSKPEPIAKSRPDVPSVIAKMVARCLQKSPGKRFQSMREVCSILKDARTASDAGVSMDSFAKRFYREVSTPSRYWWVAAAIIVLLASVISWYVFSRTYENRLISVDRVSMRRLSDAKNVGYTVISPDGKFIAYGTFEDDGTRSLWVRRIDDRNALQIVPPQVVEYWGGVEFSSDGSQVFYLTAGRTATHGSLYRVSSLGGPSRKLIDVANDVGGVSPDGQRLLFVRYGAPSRIISANTSDGGDEHIVYSPNATEGIDTNFRDPHFSPDGKSVYFIKTERTGGIQNWSLVVLPIEGGEPRQILRQAERINELAVLQDESALLITAIDPVSNLQQLFHISLVDGTKTRVTNDLFFYFGVSVDRDGRNIVISQRDTDNRVWIGDTSDFASLKPFNREPTAYEKVDWTPDGRVVYDALENNRIQIWIADADGGNLQRLTDTQADEFGPRVSGDGRYIVFTSKRSGTNQVWRMSIDGGEQAPLTDVAGVTQTPRFAADGTTVVFEWYRDRDRVLGQVPVTGGKVTQISDFDPTLGNTAYHWAISPDAKYVAYTIREAAENRTKVAVRSVESPNPVSILNIWPSRIFKWMPDGKSIFYQERTLGNNPQNEVLKIDFAGGPPKVLISTAPEYVTDLTFSHDGKRVALVRGQNTSNPVILTYTPQNP